MFIKIGTINYFIKDAKEKSLDQITDEIFRRMNSTFISYPDKRQLTAQILKQLS